MFRRICQCVVKRDTQEVDLEKEVLYDRYLGTLERFQQMAIPASSLLTQIFVTPYLLELASIRDGWKRVEVARVPNQDLFFLFQLLFPYQAPCAILANRDLMVGAMVVGVYTCYIQFYLSVVEYYGIERDNLEYYLYLYMHQEDHLREYQARRRKKSEFDYVAGSLDLLFAGFVSILQLLPNLSGGPVDLHQAKKTFFQQILVRPPPPPNPD
jgi:hypothetical protein